MTATITYNGHLRCTCTHLQSGTVTETDAPTDNQGKGERFSPTDTVCVALGTCMITTMAIKGNQSGIDLSDTTLEVTKHMLGEPRRIGKIEITLNFPGNLNLGIQDQQMLQRVADNCPVMKSLHPDLQTVVTYNW